MLGLLIIGIPHIFLYFLRDESFQNIYIKMFEKYGLSMLIVILFISIIGIMLFCIGLFSWRKQEYETGTFEDKENKLKRKKEELRHMIIE